MIPMKKDWHNLVSQPKYKMKLEENLHVKARDGVQLWADVDQMLMASFLHYLRFLLTAKTRRNFLFLLADQITLKGPEALNVGGEILRDL